MTQATRREPEVRTVLALFLPLLAAPQKEDVVVFSDPAYYSCFPSLWLAEDSTAWVLRTSDRGETWELIDIAAPRADLEFNEAALLQTPDGAVLAALRGGGREYDGFLYLCRSADGGATWSDPEKTQMWGYPADLRLLKSGDILCTYGHRRPPYGIRACFSRDAGRSWDTEQETGCVAYRSMAYHIAGDARRR